MADKRVLLTADGLKKLQEKLDFLKGERRQEVAARLKAAIALGDLSENSEYDDAKNEQAFLEGEILELEESIRNSKIIEASADSNTVSLGAQVVLKDRYTQGWSQVLPSLGRVNRHLPNPCLRQTPHLATLRILQKHAHNSWHFQPGRYLYPWCTTLH